MLASLNFLENDDKHFKSVIRETRLLGFSTQELENNEDEERKFLKVLNNEHMLGLEPAKLESIISSKLGCSVGTLSFLFKDTYLDLFRLCRDIETRNELSVMKPDVIFVTKNSLAKVLKDIIEYACVKYNNTDVSKFESVRMVYNFSLIRNIYDSITAVLLVANSLMDLKPLAQAIKKGNFISLNISGKSEVTDMDISKDIRIIKACKVYKDTDGKIYMEQCLTEPREEVFKDLEIRVPYKIPKYKTFISIYRDFMPRMIDRHVRIIRNHIFFDLLNIEDKNLKDYDFPLMPEYNKKHLETIYKEAAYEIVSKGLNGGVSKKLIGLEIK